MTDPVVQALVQAQADYLTFQHQGKDGCIDVAVRRLLRRRQEQSQESFATSLLDTIDIAKEYLRNANGCFAEAIYTAARELKLCGSAATRTRIV